MFYIAVPTKATSNFTTFPHQNYKNITIKQNFSELLNITLIVNTFAI